jgi:hypothetical protein
MTIGTTRKYMHGNFQWTVLREVISPRNAIQHYFDPNQNIALFTVDPIRVNIFECRNHHKHAQQFIKRLPFPAWYILEKKYTINRFRGENLPEQ